MPTNQDEKPAKPRTRSRKASGQKTKAGPKAQALRDQAQPDQVALDAAETASPVIVAPLEDAAVDVTTAETAPVELAMAEVPAAEVPAAEVVPDVTPLEVAPEAAPVTVALEQVREEKAERTAHEAPLNGEVLPPDVRDPAPAVASLAAIAQAYGEYTRKSWLNGRSLVERLIAMRSFDEAIEIQGEFAKQAYTNFIVQSQKISVLYAEWAHQVFRPLEKFASGWPRIGR